MSLISKVKENLNKEEEKPQKKVLVKEEKNIKLFDFEFKKYQYMNEIKEGQYELIPTSCALSHYLLVNKGVGYYCGLEDNETGNLFEIYEYDVGEDEPNMRAFDLNMDWKTHLHFLIDKIKEGYDIYVEKN